MTAAGPVVSRRRVGGGGEIVMLLEDFDRPVVTAVQEILEPRPLETPAWFEQQGADRFSDPASRSLFPR